MNIRNRAPLSAVLAATLPPEGHSPEEQNNVTAITENIAAVRVAADKADPQFGQIARQTQFIDLDHITPTQRTALADDIRGTYPTMAKASDAEVMQVLDRSLTSIDFNVSAAMPGTHSIIYSSKEMSGFSPNATQVAFAHDLGHLISHEKNAEKGGLEKTPDHLAAQILGPQAVVDGLAEFARLKPSTNDRAVVRSTDYQRAVDLKAAFPAQHVDISKVPTQIDSKATKANGAPPKVAVAASQTPGF